MVRDMIVPLEADEQKAIVQWLRLKKYDFFAPLNENVHSFLSRDLAIKLEAKLKAMGKLKGTLDLVIFLPKKILFLEMKRRPKLLQSGKLSYTNSKTSDEQLDFIKMVGKYDYAIADVAYGYSEAIEIVRALT